MVQKSLKDRFINQKMKKGKKSLCEKQMFVFFKLFQKNNKKNINLLFKHALVKTTPSLSLRKVTRSSDKTIKNYPYILNKNTRISLSLRHLIKPFSILNCLNIQDWIKMLNEKSITKNLFQDRAIQEKKLLRYRWFF